MYQDRTSPGGLWWDSDAGGKLHERVAGTVEQCQESDAGRQSRYLRMARLYTNRHIKGLSPSQYERYADDPDAAEDAPRLNVVRSMVDAVQAKIAKNRPRASFLTQGGDFGLQQKARKLEQFVWGLFYQSRVYDIGPLIFRDACVYGTGVMRVYGEAHDGKKAKGKVGRICAERVYPWELLVDPAEAAYGEPRSLFHVRVVDRGVLRALFPDNEEEINDAPSARNDERIGGMVDAFCDQVIVYEGWHLPSGPTSGDGKHAIVLRNATLVDEEYESERFPYAFLHWGRPLVGFWGNGLGEEVEGVQAEINELLLKAQQAMFHHATPKVIVSKGADVSIESDFDNDLRGCIIEVAGSPSDVQFVTPSSVSPEVFAQLDRLFQRAYEIVGVSQLAAQSKKPAGLDSGVALREYNDIESERFVIRGQEYESLFIQVAELMVEQARMLHDDGAEITVDAEDKRRRRHFLKRIKWSEVSMDEDAYQMKVFPTSSLPQTPAGKKAAVEGLLQAGLIDQTMALELLDLPDLESVVHRQLAPYEVVLDQIEQMIDEAEPQVPEPFQDLQQAVKVVQHAYLRAKMDRVPEERLQLLRDYLDAAAALEAPPEQAPPVTAPMPPQGGVPAPAPVEPPMPGAPPVAA